MLKIVNNSGEEMMTLHDDGRETFADKKLEEQFKQSEKSVKEDQ